MYTIKQSPEEFIVEEIMPDGTVLELGKKWKFEDSEGDHLICVLEKKNWDMHLAIRKITDRLHVSKKRIGFAGTKDKRAWTTQRISLWRMPIEDVESMKINDITLHPLGRSDERINLGDLQGNRFTIKVQSDKEPKKLKRVANFFGVQRFGVTRPTTHLVGEQIAKGNFEKAVKIYLAKVFDAEGGGAKTSRQKLAKDWNYKDALDYFPKNLKFERTMIAHLTQHPDDYIGALRKLPKHLKIMFSHAWQAWLFNKELKKTPEKEELELKAFEVEKMPEMGCKNIMRKTHIELKDLEIKKESDGYILKFSLPKGSYATTVIEQLFS